MTENTVHTGVPVDVTSQSVCQNKFNGVEWTALKF